MSLFETFEPLEAAEIEALRRSIRHSGKRFGVQRIVRFPVDHPGGALWFVYEATPSVLRPGTVCEAFNGSFHPVDFYGRPLL